MGDVISEEPEREAYRRPAKWEQTSMWLGRDTRARLAKYKYARGARTYDEALNLLLDEVLGKHAKRADAPAAEGGNGE